MWILRNLTEDHGGRGGEKNSYNTDGGRETISDKYREQLRFDGGWGTGESG